MRTAVDPATPVTHLDAQDSDGAAAQPPHFDPRQGTLLGFELPEGVLLSMAASARGEARDVEQREAGGAGRDESVDGENGVAAAIVDEQVISEQLVMGEKSVAAGQPAVAERSAVATKTVSSRKAAGAGRAATPAKVEAPAKAEASAKAEALVQAEALARAETSPKAETSTQLDLPAKTESAKPAEGAAPAGARRPTALPAAAATLPEVAPALPESPEPTPLARTVASLEAAFAHERRASEECWRRMRHWLALASAGLALLFVVCIAQLVALIGFAHRTQAAQLQTQSILNEQQTALAGLANSTAALSANMPSPEAPDAASAPSNAAQPPAKHTKPAHLRHLKEKAKPAVH